MKKKYWNLVLAVVLLFAAGVGVYIYKTDSSKAASEQQLQNDEIQVTEEEDGSYTFRIPLTVTNQQTGEAQTQWTTVNSKDMPAKILIQIEGQENVVLSVNLEGTNLQVEFYPESEETDENVVYLTSM